MRSPGGTCSAPSLVTSSVSFDMGCLTLGDKSNHQCPGSSQGRRVGRASLGIDTSGSTHFWLPLCLGVEGLSLDMAFLVDIRDYVNKELALRIHTDIDSQGTFFTDLNGFQVLLGPCGTWTALAFQYRCCGVGWGYARGPAASTGPVRWLLIRPGNLSSIPGTPIKVEGENPQRRFHRVLL